MRVVCIQNEVAAIREAGVRERIGRSIHMDGPVTDLVVGREYIVQALEKRDEGLWLYLQTVSTNDYPFPYPAEMFEFRETTLPSGWNLCVSSEHGNVVWKRITFSAWANDEHFYERLVHGDAEAVSLYQMQRRKI